MEILKGSDLAADYTVARLLDETYSRRSLDLSDLSPAEQAALVEDRAINVIPSASALAEKITAAQAEGRPLVVKYGIDPTSPDVHLGHSVPIIIASRFQRMGHHVVFIIGDVTAKIGDPSGRSTPLRLACRAGCKTSFHDRYLGVEGVALRCGGVLAGVLDVLAGALEAAGLESLAAVRG
ncbi:hypothetical protein [Kitasatospora aureofaciens]|uniref:hypothetical protein n=1 Tax=Kitasatospora aureofaciens TaxID=1894 RepID=UPI001F161C56|nr:hypothetical protein [Kitasatospora aureofaciens]